MAKRVIRLTESDLMRIVKRVINEQLLNPKPEPNKGYQEPPKPKVQIQNIGVKNFNIGEVHYFFNTNNKNNVCKFKVTKVEGSPPESLPRLNGDKITGVIVNDVSNFKGLKKGDEIKIIFDQEQLGKLVGIGPVTSFSVESSKTGNSIINGFFTDYCKMLENETFFPGSHADEGRQLLCMQPGIIA